MLLEVLNPANRIEIKDCTSKELDKLIEISAAKRWSWKAKKYLEVSYMNMFRFLPAGLYKRILALKKEGYNVSLSGFERIANININTEELDEFIANEEYELTPRWFQFEAFYKAIKFNRSKFEIATGGGKSFIIAMCVRYLLQHEIPKGGKILIVTIRQMLVDQMIDDIYSYKRDKLIKYQPVYAGTEQVEDANVIVGTYQSLSTWPRENFENVYAIIVDECHAGKITSIKDEILPKLNPNYCKRYMGFTGTLPDDDIDLLHLEVFFGPTLMKVTAAELQEEGSIAKIKIKMLKLIYPISKTKSYYFDEDVKNGGPARLRAERAWLHTNQERNELIKMICSKFIGNQVILVESVSYAKFLIDWLGTIPGKEVRLIYGGTKKSERNEIKQELKLEGDNYILIATYETMSTGVSINNIMALHFPDGGKSKIRIRQSLGRGLRLHPKKEFLLVFDYWDVLKKYYGSAEQNHTDAWDGPNSNIFNSHAKIRKGIYKDQKFEHTIKEFEM